MQPHWCGDEVWYARGANLTWDVWAIDADGEPYGLRCITPVNYYYDHNPDHVATCGFVLFDSGLYGLNYDIWSIDAAGSPHVPIPLTTSLSNDRDPDNLAAFGVIFQSDRAGDEDILWMDTMGEAYGWGYLTSSPSDDTQPTCSPDAFWIAFNSDRSGNMDIWIMDSSGEAYGCWQITDAPEPDARPAWSPDGSYIAFHRSGVGIFVYDVATGIEYQVTSGATDMSPAWSPDSQRIAFTRISGDSHIWVTDNLPDTAVEKISWGCIKALYR